MDQPWSPSPNPIPSSSHSPSSPPVDIICTPHMARWHDHFTTKLLPPALTHMETPHSHHSPHHRLSMLFLTLCTPFTPSSPLTHQATLCHQHRPPPFPPTTSPVLQHLYHSTYPMSTSPLHITWVPPYRDFTSTRCCRGWKSSGDA